MTYVNLVEVVPAVQIPRLRAVSTLTVLIPDGASDVVSTPGVNKRRFRKLLGVAVAGTLAATTLTLGGATGAQGLVGQTALLTMPLSGSQFTLGGNSFTVQSPEKLHSLRLASEYARMELRTGDQWEGDATKGDARQRCEMNSGKKFPLDTAIWASYAFRVTGTMPSTWTILNQMHQRPESGEVPKSPPLALHIADGRMAIATRGDTNRITTIKQLPSVTRYSAPWTDQGKWVRLVWRVKFHHKHGELKVWKDGQRIVSASGIRLGYNDEKGPTFKFGLYRQGSPLTVASQFANVEVGTANLSGRILSPLRLPIIP